MRLWKTLPKLAFCSHDWCIFQLHVTTLTHHLPCDEWPGLQKGPKVEGMQSQRLGTRWCLESATHCRCYWQGNILASGHVNGDVFFWEFKKANWTPLKHFKGLSSRPNFIWINEQSSMSVQPSIVHSSVIMDGRVGSVSDNGCSMRMASCVCLGMQRTTCKKKVWWQ